MAMLDNKKSIMLMLIVISYDIYIIYFCCFDWRRVAFYRTADAKALTAWGFPITSRRLGWSTFLRPHFGAAGGETTGFAAQGRDFSTTIDALGWGVLGECSIKGPKNICVVKSAIFHRMIYQMVAILNMAFFVCLFRSLTWCHAKRLNVWRVRKLGFGSSWYSLIT